MSFGAEMKDFVSAFQIGYGLVNSPMDRETRAADLAYKKALTQRVIEGPQMTPYEKFQTEHWGQLTPAEQAAQERADQAAKDAHEQHQLEVQKFHQENDPGPSFESTPNIGGGAIMNYGGGAAPQSAIPVPPVPDATPPTPSRDVTPGGPISEYYPRAIGGAAATGGLKGLTPATVTGFETAGKLFGQPLVLTSAYRSRQYNDALRASGHAGVAKNSQHINGDAGDISTVGMSDPQKAKLVASLKQSGFTGFGYYDTWIHADMGPTRHWGPWSKSPAAMTAMLGKGSAPAIMNAYAPTGGDTSPAAGAIDTSFPSQGLGPASDATSAIDAGSNPLTSGSKTEPVSLTGSAAIPIVNPEDPNSIIPVTAPPTPKSRPDIPGGDISKPLSQKDISSANDAISAAVPDFLGGGSSDTQTAAAAPPAPASSPDQAIPTQVAQAAPTQAGAGYDPRVAFASKDPEALNDAIKIVDPQGKLSKGQAAYAAFSRAMIFADSQPGTRQEKLAARANLANQFLVNTQNEAMHLIASSSGALDKGDFQTALSYLQQAYDIVPDGKSIRITPVVGANGQATGNYSITTLDDLSVLQGKPAKVLDTKTVSTDDLTKLISTFGSGPEQAATAYNNIMTDMLAANDQKRTDKITAQITADPNKPLDPKSMVGLDYDTQQSMEAKRQSALATIALANRKVAADVSKSESEAASAKAKEDPKFVLPSVPNENVMTTASGAIDQTLQVPKGVDYIKNTLGFDDTQIEQIKSLALQTLASNAETGMQPNQALNAVMGVIDANRNRKIAKHESKYGVTWVTTKDGTTFRVPDNAFNEMSNLFDAAILNAQPKQAAYDADQVKKAAEAAAAEAKSREQHSIRGYRPPPVNQPPIGLGQSPLMGPE